MSETSVEYFPPTKPWEEFASGVKLIGMRCSHCGTVAFPAREVCSKCGRDDALEEKVLQGPGKLYTFTEVHVAPAGFPTPYVIGYVDMPDDVRVLGQIDGRVADLNIGQDVHLRIGVIRARKDGTQVIGYRFTGEAK